MSTYEKSRLRDAAYEECEQIVRTRARNFWFGLRLTPRPKRDALHALYAWMRLVDDIADDGKKDSIHDRRQALEDFRGRTREVFAGRAIGNEPLWIAFADMVHNYEPPQGCFEEMIDGQIMDLEWESCDTWEQLRNFCYRAASTVGLLCVSIWGYDSPRAETLAVDRGIAFQLTNVLRDIHEDALRGRWYLPQDELQAHGLEASDFLAWKNPVLCLRFLESQVQRALWYYQSSEHLEDHLAVDCRASSWAMNRIYKELLMKIRKAPERVMRGNRIGIGSFRKITIATQAKILLSGARRS